ncbi:syntaxin-8 [Teleopsis dalmanni]|uniref:syntaxin-8 n=1 Tax=Teleopsis dalmanni TaxID=139649 RepID=UPI0018CFED92|nr:syntaxin-8 [Teleopsis dalmanni]
MALIDVDSWQTEYDACIRLNDKIATELNQRTSTDLQASEYQNLSASIQVGLKQFANELQQLKYKLDVAAKNRSITFENIESRQTQVDTLQSQLQQLQAKVAKTSIQHNSRHGSSQPAVIASNGIEDLRQKQIQILEDQNRGLESLSQTISRQRELATQLGLEVEDQNDILDNLANTMDNVDTRVHIETSNIGELNRRENTCGYWIAIVILTVTNILVATLA